MGGRRGGDGGKGFNGWQSARNNENKGISDTSRMSFSNSTHVHMCVCVNLCVSVCVHLCVSVCLCVIFNVYVCECEYARMCVDLCVSVYLVVSYITICVFCFVVVFMEIKRKEGWKGFG